MINPLKQAFIELSITTSMAEVVAEFLATRESTAVALTKAYRISRADAYDQIDAFLRAAQEAVKDDLEGQWKGATK